MIQPRAYPELLAKALVLEPEPFTVMASDDEPVIEGLVLTALLGAAVGAARLIGGLLFAWAMPPANALEVIARAVAGLLAGPGETLTGRMALNTWQAARFATGYDTGWARLLPLIWAPFLLLVQWLLAGLLIYAMGRALGGRGALRPILGASALIAAPYALLLLTAIPFVAVSPLLLFVWSLLILYRAAQQAHGLPWQQAAVAALISMALLLVIGAAAAALGAGALFAAI